MHQQHAGISSATHTQKTTPAALGESVHKNHVRISQGIHAKEPHWHLKENYALWGHFPFKSHLSLPEVHYSDRGCNLLSKLNFST